MNVHAHIEHACPETHARNQQSHDYACKDSHQFVVMKNKKNLDQNYQLFWAWKKKMAISPSLTVDVQYISVTLNLCVWLCVCVCTCLTSTPQHPWPMQPAHGGRSSACWVSSCHHRSRCIVERWYSENTRTLPCGARWPRYLQLPLTHTEGDTVSNEIDQIDKIIMYLYCFYVLVIVIHCTDTRKRFSTISCWCW